MDGLVARRRRGVHKQTSVFHSAGYNADATADTLGVLAFLVAIFIYLQKVQGKRSTHSYLPLQVLFLSKDLTFLILLSY
jgi:hypothetical protein